MVPRPGPPGVKIWALMPSPAPSPPSAALLVQLATKAPEVSTVRSGSCWSEAVTRLTRNSVPDLTPVASKIWALTAPLESPDAPLKSLQLTTKPPQGRAATTGCDCSEKVLVLAVNCP